MAIVRKSLGQIRDKGRVDLSKVVTTSESDIERHRAENDGAGRTPGNMARQARAQLNMTQEQFAKALRVPLATLRN